MTKQAIKKISIIIPVYNVEKYIEKCLDSLVNQTLQEIEILVVNDGSTDDSQKIIDKFVKNYPDIIKSYKIPNGGVASARNFALERATGEYIGFVDSDDYVTKDMYEKLYNKAISENADIVSCAYYKETENKCIEKETALNTSFGRSIYEVPYLLIDSVPYIWNKIFKREIIEKNSIRFSNLKIYEDLVFTYQLFINANKISKVFEPLYFYTVTRTSSLTYKFTEKRFDIFSAFQILIDYAKEKKCFEQFIQEILFILLKHIYVVLEKDVSKDTMKLKKKYIDETFEFLDRNFKDWKDNFYFDIYNKNKKRYTSKKYWNLRIVVNKSKRRKIKKVFNLVKKIKCLFENDKFVGNKFLKYMKLPIEEKGILLNSQQGDNINGNMFYILQELQINNQYNEYKIYVAYKEGKKEEYKEKLNAYNFKSLELIQVHTKEYAKILATSKYLFNDTSFPTYFIKRQEQIYLNTWHGTPLKTLGKATANDFYDIANLQKNFVVSDYLLYPSKYMMNLMVRDYMLENMANNKIMLCGYPRNEIFLNEKRREEMKIQLNAKEKKRIAYMPTWRGAVRNVSLEEQVEQVKKYLSEIDQALNDDQILYVNFHPYVGNNIDFGKYQRICAFPKKYETYDFLNTCDVLVTDYSSVFFDYALTKNKIILFTYDEAEYLKERGLYISLNDIPFPKVKNVKQLIDEINLPKQYDDKEFLEKYCKYDRVDMSKQICNKVILNGKNSIKEEQIVNSKKKNILIYAGSLNKNKKTDKLISISKKVKDKKYNYCISYITKNIKRNKRQLKLLEKAGMKYMGQLGTYSNIGKIDWIILSFISKIKILYPIFAKRLTSVNETEIKRIYDNIEFKAVLLYGKIGVMKIYELVNMKCKKIIYLTCKEDFNKKVNKNIYEKFDYILVADDETLANVKEYCGAKQKVEKIKRLDDLNDFNMYI